MTIELLYLTLVTALTGLIWIPYILNAIVVRGLFGVTGYPKDPPSLSPWAARLKSAHANAVENLVVFATLVLIAHLAGIHNETVAIACIVYFWARLAHVVTYMLAIPILRTLAFAVGFICQVILAVQILNAPLITAAVTEIIIS